MDNQLIEEIKKLLKDVESFLKTTLKNAGLNNDAVTKKNKLLDSLQIVVGKIPDSEETQETYDDVDVGPDNVPEEDSDLLYEVTDTNISEADNTSKKSLDEKDTEGDDPYGYGSAGTKIEPIPAEKLMNPTYCGVMEKKMKSLLVQGWQSRYCVIKDNVFYYYKKKSDKKQKGDIVLNGYEGRPTPHLESGKRKDCIFELVCPTKRSFQFTAPDIATMIEWIEAIRKASKASFPSATSVNTSKEAAQDFGDLYDEAVNESDDGSQDYDDTYEEVDYAAAKRKQAANTTTPLVKPVETIPDAIQDDCDDVYDDVATKEAPPIIPAKSSFIKKSLPGLPIQTGPANKELPSLPQPTVPQRIAPAPSIPLPSVPIIPPRSPKNASPTIPTRSFSPPLTPDNPVPSDQTNGEVDPEPWEEDYGNIYMSKWDCNASDDNELVLKRGELIHVLSREYDSYGWWVGEKNHKVGLVPIDYLMKAYLT